jgi:mediator of RNA polymerase II transcription subunit 13
MLTNIYRIGGLHQVSWFQLVPDAERIPPTAYRKNSGFQDLAAIAVVMAHMRLQEEGHLSCWTIPAQKDGGLSRTIAADDKVKLWIFIPGVQEAINSNLHPCIAGLKGEAKDTQCM